MYASVLHSERARVLDLIEKRRAYHNSRPSFFGGRHDLSKSARLMQEVSVRQMALVRMLQSAHPVDRATAGGSKCSSSSGATAGGSSASGTTPRGDDYKLANLREELARANLRIHDLEAQLRKEGGGGGSGGGGGMRGANEFFFLEFFIHFNTFLIQF